MSLTKFVAVDFVGLKYKFMELRMEILGIGRLNGDMSKRRKRPTL